MNTAVKNTVVARSQRGDGAQGPGPIDHFLDAVWMERGLSPNTLAAYRADLTALERWLEEHEVNLSTAHRGDILSFMAWRVQAGARPRSTARQLSSFRRFYRHLVREGVAARGPDGADRDARRSAARCRGRSRRRKSRPCWPLRP